MSDFIIEGPFDRIEAQLVERLRKRRQKLRRNAAIGELAKLGTTVGECADIFGMSRVGVYQIARTIGVRFERKKRDIPPEINARAERMAALYAGGKTLEEVAATFGLSRERVRQILKRHGLTAKDGGQHKRAERAKVQRESERNARTLRKKGCSWEQYCHLRKLGWPLRAYQAQRRNARDVQRIGWDLTLWQWWCIWRDSGHIKDRGRGKGNYGLLRRDPDGPHSSKNSYVGPISEAIRAGVMRRAEREAAE